MRLIDADKMATDELAAFIFAQAMTTDAANRDINNIVHAKIQQLIADTPTVENVEQVVRCKDCLHFEGATANAKGFLICPNTGMDIWDECYCAHGERTDNDPKEKRGKENMNNINLDEIRKLANMIDVFANCLQQDVNQHCAHGEKRIIEPQPDGIQFRTVDDLGRICIPKDIRDKLGINPGTECAVYSTDELTPDEIIVIRRNENEKTN